MTRRLVVPTLAIAISIVLIGCAGASPGATADQAGPGGASPGAPAGTGSAGNGALPAEVCSLLTVVEVSSALSTDPLTIATARNEEPAKCVYALAADDPALEMVVSANKAEQQYQQVAQTDYEPVAGVGDGALYASGNRSMYILVSGRYVILRAIYASDADTTRNALTTLGKLVAARLTTGAIPPGAELTARPVITADESCDLLTADEATSVLGQPVTKAASDYTTDFCYFNDATGTPLMTTYFHAKLGIAAWDDLLANMSTEPVDGLANKAVFEPSTGTLYVLSGDTVLNVVVYSATDVLAKDRQLMEIMLTHL